MGEVIVKTVAQIAAHVGGRVEGEADLELVGLAPLSEAGPDELSFVTGNRYKAQLEETRAGAVVVPEDLAVARPLTLIRAADANLATAYAGWLFQPPPAHPPGVSPQAAVDPSARIDPQASVYPLAYIGPGAEIGPGAVIHPQVYIGLEAKVGAETIIHPGVVLCDGVQVGRRCLLHAGVVIGADGYGFAHRPDGGHVKIPQTGTVIIEDEVEIGANTTIDRATFGRTVIGRGTKIDNLVQIGHNAVIGPDSLIVAQVGISGSTSLGRGCVLGGQAGVGDHLRLGDGVMVGAKSGVASDVEAGAVVSGIPAIPHWTSLRVWSSLPKLPQLVRRTKEMEQRLTALETSRDQGGED